MTQQELREEVKKIIMTVSNGYAQIDQLVALAEKYKKEKENV